MSKDEFMDEELAGMVSYTDETAPAEMPVMEREDCPKAAQRSVAVQDAEYATIPKGQRGQMEKLKDMVKYLGICGGISMLLWWFEANGLMAMEAAYPCILASAIIGSVGIGRSSK